MSDKIGFDVSGGDVSVDVQTETDSSIASFWKVLLWNDDYHSMEYVVLMIKEIFRKDVDESMKHMLEIHNDGFTVVATCSKERAELYLEQVAASSEGSFGPLNCSIEPDE